MSKPAHSKGGLFAVPTLNPTRRFIVSRKMAARLLQAGRGQRSCVPAGAAICVNLCSEGHDGT